MINALPGPVGVLRTINQILAAGIAITAFSLLLYALTFNLRDRVARSFALILVCVAVAFTGEAIGSAATDLRMIDFWYRVQWVGILFLPATYLQFSDALLETTGKPSRGRRVLAVRLTYLGCLFLFILLPTNLFIGPLVADESPAPYLRPTLLTTVFTLCYLGVMALSWINFARAYRRTRTATSHRRMTYLIISALAPTLGLFPFLLFGLGVAGQHPLMFWSLSVITNLVVGGLVVVMAYSVAFFGVSWPDRVVRSRLFKWLMRGPVTASITLGITTIVRRAGEVFGAQYTAMVPIVMVVSLLLCEYLITLFSPLGDRILFASNDRSDLQVLRNLEDHVLTRNDLRQFLEMVLAAVCDHLQVPGAYIAALGADGVELVVTTGRTRFDQQTTSDELLELVARNGGLPDRFQWGEDTILPLFDQAEGFENNLLGLLGINGLAQVGLEDEQREALQLLTGRAVLALHNRRQQTQIFQYLEALAPGADYIQRMRAAGRYDEESFMQGKLDMPGGELVPWVKEALTHYWGGPKLTESPLMQLNVVKDAANQNEGNYPNALRSILRQAIERVRPEGERRFTGEWILYNILEMKFLEGKKVREIAMRLAVSEADLYRKQRIAIEAVAHAMLEMENEARHNASVNGDDLHSSGQ